VEYSSAIKKSEIMSFAEKWVETIMLSELNQAHKDEYHMFSLTGAT
jgi:hypothetical protein